MTKSLRKLCKLVILTFLWSASTVEVSAQSGVERHSWIEGALTGIDYQPGDPLAIAGVWQVTNVSDNQYRMAVVWDQVGQVYRGYLTLNGEGSAEVGFRVGELVWRAYLTSDTLVLNSYQLFRYGQNRRSTGQSWVRGKTYVSLEGSSRTMTMYVRGIQIRFSRT